MRQTDGCAGDANYGRTGTGYMDYRHPDPRTYTGILGALGGDRTVLNVGTGVASYEPRYRAVTAVESSDTIAVNALLHCRSLWMP